MEIDSKEDVDTEVKVETDFGGKLTGYYGEGWDIYQCNTVVSNGLIHEELKSKLLPLDLTSPEERKRS